MSSSPPVIRTSPEDFQVDEIALYPPSGEGTHTFLRVEKRLRNSEEVARDLASAAGVSRRDVGYAGRKDRRAVTRQWFSVPQLDPDRALELEIPGARVLEAARHGHKLRTGHLAGNCFDIRLRGVDREAVERARARLDEIIRIGMPNRFGAQRFGHSGENVARGRAILMGTQRMAGDRRSARFQVSALQSAVFNAVLAERPLALDAVECGDVARVEASGGLFIVEDSDVENSRAARFEISATGPIFGTKMKRPTGVVAEREARALAALDLPDLDDVQPPRGIRLTGGRRPLRVRPGEVKLEEEPETLRLHFSLPAGSYATVLLEELVGEFDEARGTGRERSGSVTDGEH